MRLLAALARSIDAFNRAMGRTVSWIVVPMVLIQVAIVLMRYVFGIGSIMLQESVIYMHAVLFMATVGYTLLHDEHVRIDIFYRETSPRRKALVDLVGTLIFLIPVCALIWWVSLPYVRASWRVLEGSKETSGIPGVFLLKSLLLLFTVLLAAQGVSMAIRSVATLAGLPWPAPRPTDDRL
ncbi:TRAP transporter small permease subunit [Shumkonia mesophila]|uniref:TRAP transporter small permease subunit n=1 Tax=Shumkonia mesophila TaxID=2838854 RepID=UPI0029352C05|nr:TRAP transporter small permease subunit [Shumkonia mesophila]